MRNGYFRKFGVAALAAGVVTMAAWRAPQASGTPSAAPTASVATVATTVPGVVTSASFAPIVERVMPAVVTIRVEKRAAMIPTDQQIPDEFRRFFGDQMPQMPRGQRQPRRLERGLGSGVIASQDGYILTNNHVVEGVDTVKVELPDNRTFTAKVVGTDPATDLAVVKIDAKNLPTLVFGDSDAVKVGDVALAFGNPLGVGETVTSGIISAKGRTTNAGDSYQDFLQTDAAINHGNSGGALVNAAGDLIGINSQILSPSDGNIGLGFAIPSNMAKHVMDQLISGGTVRRAKLGVTVQGITADLASSLGLASAQGALVSHVEEGSAASRAGLKQGDVITHYNGKSVADNNQLRNAVASTKPGATVPVQILRNGRSETLQATVGELAARKSRLDAPSEAKGEGQYGMSVKSSPNGLLVTQLDPSGIAAESGVREGDVIEKANGKTIKTVEDLKSALDRKDGKASLVLINREGTALFLTLAAR